MDYFQVLTLSQLRIKAVNSYLYFLAEAYQWDCVPFFHGLHSRSKVERFFISAFGVPRAFPFIRKISLFCD